MEECMFKLTLQIIWYAHNMFKSCFYSIGTCQTVKMVKVLWTHIKVEKVLCFTVQSFSGSEPLGLKVTWQTTLSNTALSVSGKKFGSRPSSVFKLISLPTSCWYGLDVTWNSCKRILFSQQKRQTNWVSFSLGPSVIWKIDHICLITNLWQLYGVSDRPHSDIRSQ